METAAAAAVIDVALPTLQRGCGTLNAESFGIPRDPGLQLGGDSRRTEWFALA
jgi:hypothetical protein